MSSRASSRRRARAARRAPACCCSKSIHDRFWKSSSPSSRSAKMGDPALARHARSDRSRRGRSSKKILDYIRIAKEEGARCVLGGNSRSDLGAGLFVEPTIFTDVKNSMRIAQEEVFGPVLAVIPFEDEADAIDDRQRRRLRARSGGVDEEPPPGDGDDRQAQGGNDLGQQLSGDELHVAVRRLQELGYRPRVRSRDDQGIPVDEVRLDFHGPRRAQSVHPPRDDVPCVDRGI